MSTIHPLLLTSQLAIVLDRMRDRPIHGGPGIDVSHHQGLIDWQRVYRDMADDAAFDDKPWVYIKATEGAGYIDPRFEWNVAQAHQAGFRVGAYHFCRVVSGTNAIVDATQEVASFVRAMNGLPLTLVPCLDFELGGIKKRKPAYCMDWWEAATLQLLRHYGQEPLQYTGYWTWRWVGQHLDKVPDWLVMCPLWQAEYSNGDAPVRTIDGWTPLLWQHTARGRVDGIDRKVDRNVVLGSVLEFRRRLVMDQGVLAA